MRARSTSSISSLQRVLLVSLAGGLTAVNAVGCGKVVDANPAGGMQDPGDPSTTEADSGSPERTDGGSKDGSASTDLEGSYDVRFSVVGASGPNGDPNVTGSAPPSLEVPFRLDLRRDDSGSYSAVLTGRWFGPAAMSVTLSKDFVTLTGNASVSKTQLGGAISDTWANWRLDRATTGALTGAFSATGTETSFMGDVGGQADISGSGSFAIDSTAPETKAAPTSKFGPSDKLLPWDDISVQLAEPILFQAARDAVAIGPSTTTPIVKIAWDAPTVDGTEWSGVTQLVAHLSSWNVGDGAWTLTAGAMFDRVALMSAAFATPLTFAPVPGPAASIGFDGDVVSAALWGSSQLYGGGLTGQADARCESGGCLALAIPSGSSACSATGSGLATRLTLGTQNKVEIRYRLLANPEPGSPQFDVFGSEFRVQVASIRGASTQGGAQNQTADFAVLSNPIDGFGYATAWSTLVVPAPAGGNGAELGVAINTQDQTYCYGPAVPRPPMEVLIESVSSL